MTNDLVQEARQRLQTRGGRMTAQRALILSTLDSLDTHPTAEELHELAARQDSSLHLSTVYRTLRWLEEEGLVSSRRFDENRRQDRFDPMLPSQHHHFLCTACGSVIEFDHSELPAIKADFERRHGARVDIISLVFYGLCARCSQNEANGDGT